MKKSIIIRLNREQAENRLVEQYVENYVPVNIELPKRNLATAKDYFSKQSKRTGGYFR